MPQYHITGLPVIDSRNRLVGVISATDILNFEHESVESAEDANADMERDFDPETDRWELLGLISSFDFVRVVSET